MYEPKGNGKDRSVNSVAFVELEPPSHLRDVVHRFLELKTAAELQEDYRFHALPDACTYVVLDQLQKDVAGITRLRASSEELNLGRAFHFVNIRFLPGVWQLDREEISYGLIEESYKGKLPLVALNEGLSGPDLLSSQPALVRFVEQLLEDGSIIANPVTQKIFQRMADIHTVADMAEAAGLSPRQLQRVLKKTTGFAPHDFLKVLRLQQSLEGEPSLSYADQSHFIHSFRKATGYTPAKYARKFDV
ncbi:MAG: helix-turn-helix transcriptional regulator [Roseibium sp.]|nr:helix-turn-helix transcriptional regulator [Roseibium sp.]